MSKKEKQIIDNFLRYYFAVNEAEEKQKPFEILIGKKTKLRYCVN